MQHCSTSLRTLAGIISFAFTISPLSVFAHGGDPSQIHIQKGGMNRAKGRILLNLGALLFFIVTFLNTSTVTANNVLHIVVRGANNRIYINSSENGGSHWTGWAEVPGGGKTKGNPSVVARGAELDVVVQGINDRIYINTRRVTGAWTGWAQVPGNGVTPSGPAVAALGGPCPPDAVKVGPLCVDKYEASVWQTSNAVLIEKLQQGRATLNELIAGAVQRGGSNDDYPCLDTGNNCSTIYAASIPNVLPSARLTWFQAQQACANAGKRLLTNAEWQMAAAGSPADGGPCVTSGAGPGLTGIPGCTSRWGAFDMVGNVWEWVADWVPQNTTCGSWDSFSNDLQCFAGPSGTPSALIRGGGYTNNTAAGVFAILGQFRPQDTNGSIGFRCGR